MGSGMAMAGRWLIDLRSDTVTKPSQAMRQAMAAAEVGDDWFGDDPTVNRLQDRVAELTGRDAALYLPTGTLCNQIAMHAFTRAGHLVVCEETAHTCGMELSSSAVLSGIAFRRLRAPSRGLLPAGQVATALEPDPYDVTVVDLVALENTHQVGGGAVMPAADVAAVSNVCAQRSVPLYLDGARIFNACTVTGAAVADYAAHVDAMMFCLSKGLGAPIGSVLIGDTEFIREARRLKVLFGAAWRQAGIMAAAGLIALEEGPKRLHEDHATARRLAEGVAEILPGSLDPDSVETNIVFVDISGTGHSLAEWMSRLAGEGVIVTTVGGRVRMLTHVDVDERDIDTALAVWRRVAKELRTPA
jgi:threonine aldolase